MSHCRALLTDKQFPLYLWDCLIHQAILTLSLVQRLEIDPNHQQATITLQGIRVLVHRNWIKLLYMGSTCSQGMVCGPHHANFPMLLNMDCTNQMQRNHRHIYLIIWKYTHVHCIIERNQHQHNTRHPECPQKPTTGSPLGLLTDTETETLKQITNLLHNKQQNQ